MNLESKKSKLRELNDHDFRLMRQLDEVRKESRELKLEICREEHPCECVKLNRDIEIYDMTELIHRNRECFGLGFVAELLSARKDCQLCHGSGIPT